MHSTIPAGQDAPATGVETSEPVVPVPSDTQDPPGASTPGEQDAARSRRRTLIPRWLPWVLAGIVAVVALTAGAIVWRSRTGLVAVPNVGGLDVPTAKERLQQAGMVLQVGDRRFSANVARGLIVEQRPAPGTLLHTGSRVIVAVSAGSESFRMPEVIGLKLNSARAALEKRGLDVVVDYAPSELPSGTVMASFPSAGVTMSTGDTVRITVATADRTSGLLLPADLRGRTFVLDPAPLPVAGMPDAPLDVARRTRALLEASGATVTVTRDVTDMPGISVDERVRRATEASSTAVVGLAVTQSGLEGITVLTVPAAAETSSFFIGSTSLGGALQAALRPTFPAVRTTPGVGDAILMRAGTPAARVVLGSAGTPADVRSFADPAWADSVAQAVYRSLASLYGSR